MPVTNTKKTTTPKKSAAPTSVSDIVVRRSQQHKKSVPVLTADKVPAGTYRATVLAVNDAQNDEGNPMVDVVYRFTSPGGKSAEAKIRYPIVGYYIDRLVDALIDAGLSEGASLVDAVGLEEEVTIVYPYDGALGKIKTRRPANQAVSPAAKKPVSKQVPTKSRKLLVEDDEDEEIIEDDDSEFEDYLDSDD
jgi:hypothetical protein